jgi:hypothetical protein
MTKNIYLLIEEEDEKMKEILKRNEIEYIIIKVSNDENILQFVNGKKT